ncbi:hypothetical protein T492DRAFT_895414 [Pavlovales sp. CCMP2436]|nr:hypothetical protein T492DRAFT_895414 [Pavlovales sp. CCMP2436]
MEEDDFLEQDGSPRSPLLDRAWRPVISDDWTPVAKGRPRADSTPSPPRPPPVAPEQPLQRADSLSRQLVHAPPLPLQPSARVPLGVRRPPAPFLAPARQAMRPSGRPFSKQLTLYPAQQQQQPPLPPSQHPPRQQQQQPLSQAQTGGGVPVLTTPPAMPAASLLGSATAPTMPAHADERDLIESGGEGEGENDDMDDARALHGTPAQLAGASPLPLSSPADSLRSPGELESEGDELLGATPLLRPRLDGTPSDGAVDAFTLAPSTPLLRAAPAPPSTLRASAGLISQLRPSSGFTGGAPPSSQTPPSTGGKPSRKRRRMTGTISARLVRLAAADAHELTASRELRATPSRGLHQGATDGRGSTLQSILQRARAHGVRVRRLRVLRVLRGGGVCCLLCQPLTVDGSALVGADGGPSAETVAVLATGARGGACVAAAGELLLLLSPFHEIVLEAAPGGERAAAGVAAAPAHAELARALRALAPLARDGDGRAAPASMLIAPAGALLAFDAHGRPQGEEGVKAEATPISRFGAATQAGPAQCTLGAHPHARQPPATPACAPSPSTAPPSSACTAPPSYFREWPLAPPPPQYASGGVAPPPTGCVSLTSATVADRWRQAVVPDTGASAAAPTQPATPAVPPSARAPLPPPPTQPATPFAPASARASLDSLNSGRTEAATPCTAGGSDAAAAAQSGDGAAGAHAGGWDARGVAGRRDSFSPLRVLALWPSVGLLVGGADGAGEQRPPS